MDKKRGLEIQVASDLDSYFQQQVLEVSRKQGLQASPFATQYLGRVLTRFTNTDNFLAQDAEKKRQVPTLALLWLQSLGSRPTEQYLQMQLLGDIALFTSGFFADRFKSSVVDLDYYAAMGGRAYERAAKIRESIASERALNVFFELSTGFTEFVEVFAEIADQALLLSDPNLLKLYEKWLQNGSERIARMLAENGVIAAGAKADDS